MAVHRSPPASAATLGRRIDQALRRAKADLVVRGARILDLATGDLIAGDIAIAGDTIVGTGIDYDGVETLRADGLVAVPGFIDAHVHCESSLVTPLEFDRCVVPRGTTTAICDPHEIANVLGTVGLDFMLAAAEATVLDLRVQLPSCVPSTELETSGARLDAADLVRRADRPKVIGLAEMMNFPGLFAKDPAVLDKLAAFSGRMIDGHAPLLTGRELNAYLACGVRNCHESTRIDEAREKLSKGMQVLIRDGSVSKDVAALASLLNADTSPFVGFCTDDRNPLDIAIEGHVDHLIREAIRSGVPAMHAYRAASWSTARHFGLVDRGLVAPGQRADIVLVADVDRVAVTDVILAGRRVGPDVFASRSDAPTVGRGSIRLDRVTAADFAVPAAAPSGPVIGLRPGSIVTDAWAIPLPIRDGVKHADPANDVLKICVFARHGRNRNVGRGFVKGFGPIGGALASSVGHDSHNVCVVGAGDADMAVAVNRLIDLEGGFVAVRNGEVVAELALPIAGLMSDKAFEAVAADLRALRAAVRGMGCPLAEPFLQLAFLPLPVIPHLKITDMGLVDVDRQRLVTA
jgi:adenine deaminase